MIEPKEIEIENKKYILTKFPAFEGMSIMTKLPISAVPKLGNHDVCMQTALEILSYVYIPIKDASPLKLSTKELVNCHIKDWETCIKITWEMARYNCSFFTDERLSNFLEEYAQKAQQWSSKTLTRCLQQLSQTIKQHSEN